MSKHAQHQQKNFAKTYLFVYHSVQWEATLVCVLEIPQSGDLKMEDDIIDFRLALWPFSSIMLESSLETLSSTPQTQSKTWIQDQ